MFRLRKGDVKKYSAIPFVHGLFEYRVKNLDRELAELCNAYWGEGFGEAIANCGGYFLRTIPIGESLSPEYRVASYEDALEILKGKDLIVVANCKHHLVVKYNFTPTVAVQFRLNTALVY